IATRKVFVTPCTFKPDSAWMRSQAEAFLEHVKQESMEVTTLSRDNDGMYVKEFSEVFRDAGIQIKRGRPASPNLRAHIERFEQSIQQECLDHFLVLGERHFDYLIREYVEHYHRERPHQGLGNVPLAAISSPPKEETVNPQKIVCHERLGGLLKHYSRAA
ncbi:MAG: integrase core domain-containing protein, partial [Planctomycetaceae bacterium]|nr:integrase core domain-containing protein [Planctomycetaceae bacterium]